MIPITKPFLPPIEEFESYTREIWKRGWLTNHGPLSSKLELQLKDYLDVPHLLWLTNGTIAIQIAIKALDIKGEVITTPFSYVATTSSIVWENCMPVFVDIDNETLNIDPLKIESAITDKTTAILATHVYGNPCEIDAIEKIAKKHNLKVIFDAAHCFGSKYKGKSVFTYGDVVTTSFHATKIFHTVEGGAVFSNDPALIKRMSYMRNFGHDHDFFPELGINGKNSELHAAMGLVNLNYIDAILAKRKDLCNYYDQKLKTLKIRKPKLNKDSETNYSYYPVVFDSEVELLRAVKILNGHLVYPRRYFFPSLNTNTYLNNTQKMPISEDISKRVLCLPLFHELTFDEIDLVARLLLRAQNN